MGGRVLRFGLGLPGVQQIPARSQPWERELSGTDLITAAREAERAGFAWVSCSDHVAVPTSRAAAMGAVWYDAGSTLAFVAGATSRIALLSHVLVLPYRHPLVVAKQYGTLDHLSGGRLILGVGSGHLKPEFAILGADYARRGRVTDQYIHAITAAWEQEVACFDGQTLAFRDVMVAPRVAQRPRPPIWVGGNSRAAFRHRPGRQARGRGACRRAAAPPPPPARRLAALHQPSRARVEPLPPPARAQPGRLVSLGRRGLRGGQAPRAAGPAERRLLDPSLVP